MKLVVARVERALKSSLEELASNAGRSLSDVVRDLAIIGIDLKKRGGINIIGPMGLRRRFARTNSSSMKDERLSVWLDEEMVGELEEFGENLRSALGEVIRLGLLRLRPDKVEIRGPFGVIRPFATVTFPELSGRARDALRRLQGLPER